MCARQQGRRVAGPALALPPWGDCLLAASLLIALDEPGLDPYRYFGGLRWALAAAMMTLPLAWRRHHPLLVWAAVTSIGALLLPAADPGVVAPLLMFPAPLIALYTVTALTSRWLGRLALALSALALEEGLARHGVGPDLVVMRFSLVPEIAVLALGAVITAWALGERSRSSRDTASALAGRAAALVAERAERDNAAAADERARIAGELHDIVAHHISVVALQAGTARLLAESGQPPGAELLSGIETASRQAMSEIRAALGVIRCGADGPAPVPGAGRLPELAERMALAGLAVTIGGSAGTLPASLDLTVYRIVQEGLTNVLRHSGSPTCAVSFRRTRGPGTGWTLEIVVADGGPARDGGSATGPGGHGLIGLRERVARAGGQLRAAALPGGGFELRAWLPVSADTPRTPEPAAATTDAAR
jgi:signal transduction histidine kinase